MEKQMLFTLKPLLIFNRNQTFTLARLSWFVRNSLELWKHLTTLTFTTRPVARYIFIRAVMGEGSRQRVLSWCTGSLFIRAVMGERAPIRFGGMRDSHFFAVIFGIWAQNLGGSGNLNYERERDILFSSGWDSGFVREQSGIRDFNPSFACLWNPRVHAAIFSGTLLSRHARETKRKRATSKIDQRKNRELAKTNLLCG